MLGQGVLRRHKAALFCGQLGMLGRLVYYIGKRLLIGASALTYSLAMRSPSYTQCSAMSTEKENALGAFIEYYISVRRSSRILGRAGETVLPHPELSAMSVLRFVACPVRLSTTD